MGVEMKLLLVSLFLLNVYTLVGVTAEELYGRGYAYHTHTAYGLRVAGK